MTQIEQAIRDFDKHARDVRRLIGKFNRSMRWFTATRLRNRWLVSWFDGLAMMWKWMCDTTRTKGVNHETFS